ncbi:S8 family serine peptidase [Streptomyces sp. NPDC057743]|uniref:S8 family serine peptidase n=1 Tax=Streptomyces sp. NPDC057743 TaxID=3346236 RepID=UPI00367B8648
MSKIDDKHDALISQGILDLGAATGDEEPLYDGGSCRTYQFGRIYFHPRIGDAFEVHGAILDTYLEVGAERSALGYPLTDESDQPGVTGGRMNSFEQGAVLFDPASGTTVQLTDRQDAPEVIVKIVDGVTVPLEPGASLDLDQFASQVLGPGSESAVATVRALLPDLTVQRVFDSVSADQIQSMVDQAIQNQPDYTAPNFNNYLEIDCPTGSDTDALATALASVQSTVEYAYTMPSAADPVVGTTNPLFAQQGYLSPALDGIGVQAAWAKGADGSNTQFIDLEQGWFIGHEDLPAGLRLIDGVNRNSSFAHGCAVVGEVAGVDNARGICGIAPNTSTRLISYFRPKEATNSTESRQTLANMIMRAQSELALGDVLLVEAQLMVPIGGTNFFVPVETDPGCFKAIELATARGVIVVEPAGNGLVNGIGSANLDDFVDRFNRHALNRTLPAEFQESRAIMVGAAASASPHSRDPDSNFGSRIDCYAWGDHVVTSGNPSTPTKPDAYWTSPFFGKTSGATAIIAGVCLLVQNLFTTLNPGTGGPGKLGPVRMRNVLTDPRNSTVGAPNASIGVMPDLKKLIASEFV